ncbi:MAG: hypothetical protein KJZ78_05130 [Bryobacteraceae bacterium]|nr:hypothetical protein [Bryobacteraceae bacterium]
MPDRQGPDGLLQRPLPFGLQQLRLHVWHGAEDSVMRASNCPSSMVDSRRSRRASSIRRLCTTRMSQGFGFLQPVALLQEPEQAHETARDQIVCVGRLAAAQDEVSVQGIIMLRVQLLDDPEGTPLTAGTVTLQ